MNSLIKYINRTLLLCYLKQIKQKWKKHTVQMQN